MKQYHHKINYGEFKRVAYYTRLPAMTRKDLTTAILLAKRHLTEIDFYLIFHPRKRLLEIVDSLMRDRRAVIDIGVVFKSQSMFKTVVLITIKKAHIFFERIGTTFSSDFTDIHADYSGFEEMGHVEEEFLKMRRQVSATSLY